MKSLKSGDRVRIHEPQSEQKTGVVLGDSPSTKKMRGRSLDGSLQWRYKVRVDGDEDYFIDEQYLTKIDTRTHADRAIDKRRYAKRKTRAYALVNRLANEAGMELDEYLDMMEIRHE